MFNSQMMGAMGNSNIPSVKELWQNEKSQYRHWILLFGIGILVALSLYVTSFVMNQMSKEDIKENLIASIKSNNIYKLPQVLVQADSAWRTNYLIIPILIIVMMTFGLLYYVTTVINSYQKKSFAKISQWSTFVIGFGAILAFFQLFSMLWRVTGPTFKTPGGIFEFVNHFIIIAVYFSSSVRISRIRRQFQISEKFEIIKNNPHYNSTMQQAQQMMQEQGIWPKNTGSFVPPAKKTSNSQNINPNQKTQAQNEKNQVLKDLELMSTKDLKKVAKKLSISGYLTMTKPELIKVILRVTSHK